MCGRDLHQITWKGKSGFAICHLRKGVPVYIWKSTPRHDNGNAREWKGAAETFRLADRDTGLTQSRWAMNSETGHLRCSMMSKEIKSSPLSQNPYSIFGLLHPWPSISELLSWNLLYFPSGQSVDQELLPRQVDDKEQRLGTRIKESYQAPPPPPISEIKKLNRVTKICSSRSFHTRKLHVTLIDFLQCITVNVLLLSITHLLLYVVFWPGPETGTLNRFHLQSQLQKEKEHRRDP